MDDQLDPTSGLDLAELYHTERARLVRIAAGMGLRHAEAEDTIQETYLGLQLQKGRFASNDDARRWLLRVTINRCMLHCRAAAGAKVIEAGDTGKSPEDTLGWTRAVESSVGGLHAEDRAMIVLRYHCDMDAAEIGRLFDIPAPTVRARLHRARLDMAGVSKNGAKPGGAPARA